MADVSHELGALRFVVDSPLSSKVAMFNNAATKHQQSQHLNPFSQSGGLPKPTFNKNEYGKPLAGSLTEMRGQKANIHVLKEMLELCQIIDSEGYSVKDEPTMKVIPFGELFNIYTYISDKVVGILLRARKHKLIEFEGEVLFQRRDDNVPIFLLKPIQEIRKILEQKQEEIRRSVSPAPQATTVMMDQQQRSLSLSPKPSKKSENSKKSSDNAEASTKEPEIVKPIAEASTKDPEIVKPIAQKATPAAPPTITVQEEQQPKQENSENSQTELTAEPSETRLPDPKPSKTEQIIAAEEPKTHEAITTEVATNEAAKIEVATIVAVTTAVAESTQFPIAIAAPQTVVTPPTPTLESSPEVDSTQISDEKTDINNNAEGEASNQTADASSNTEYDPPAEGPSPL